MFGCYRTYLALLVMVFHLLGVPLIGQVAVFSFFVLSGFLMTMIMAQSYGYTAAGRTRYALNRAFRLFPPYWAALFFALGVVLWCGPAFMMAYKPDMAVPRDPIEWLANATMTFPRIVPYDFVPRLIPAAWALTVELVYYVAIGLGIARTPRRSLLWLIGSMIFSIAVLWLKVLPEFRYGAIPAGSLPFAAGAVSYHYRDRIAALLPTVTGIPGLSMLAMHPAAVAMTLASKFILPPAWALQLALFAIIPLSAIITVQLHGAGLKRISRAVDTRLGDYSYPIYLLHWPAGALAAKLIYDRAAIGPNADSAVAFITALGIVIVLGTLIVQFVDPLTNRVRDAIRGRS